MIIKEIIPIAQHRLLVVAEDGRRGEFDVSPYIQSETFDGEREMARRCIELNGRGSRTEYCMCPTIGLHQSRT